MVRILEVNDKTGRTIYLTDERYQHIKKHPEMQNNIVIIEQAIKNPIKIKNYSLDPDIKYYYSYHKDRKLGKYLRVIIKYLNGEGFVITAYFVADI